MNADLGRLHEHAHTHTYTDANNPTASFCATAAPATLNPDTNEYLAQMWPVENRYGPHLGQIFDFH